MNTNQIMLAIACAASVSVLASCSQSSREEAIDRVSDAAKTLNGKSDTTPDVVKQQQKKDRERQNTQWTTENVTTHPIEACNAKLDEIQSSEDKALIHYNRALSMKLTAERAKRSADAETAKFTAFLDQAKPALKAAMADGKWPVEINGYSFSESGLRAKMKEALKKRAFSEARGQQEAEKVSQLEQAMKTIQETRKKLAEEKERVQAVKRNVELGAFQNDINGFAAALNGGVRLDDLEAVGQTAGVGLSPDVFAPSEAKEDEALLESFLNE